MIRKSHCQQLTDVCTPDIYKMNPFQAFRVFPFSPEKTLRRRREDLEAALGLGEKAWQAEFAPCVFYNSEMGTYYYPMTHEWLEQMFERLRSPQQRFVDQFFWYWSLESLQESALEAVLAKDFEKADAIWKSAERSSDLRISVISRHNQTIYRHFKAIADEQDFCDLPSTAEEAAESWQCLANSWNDSFGAWEQLLCDEDFWEVVKEQVTSEGDQRLTGGWIQRFRDELPWALKRINAHFAASYSESMYTGEEEPDVNEWRHDTRIDLDRHIDYMRKYLQPHGALSTNVDAFIFASILEPIDNHIGNLVRRGHAEIAQNPKKSFTRGNSLIATTRGYRKYLKDYLGQGNPDYKRICDTIADFCNHCAVSRGTEAARWENAIMLLERAIPIAQSPSLKATMQDNLDFFQQKWKEQRTCWFCKKPLAVDACAYRYRMYGDIHINTHALSNSYRAEWRTIDINIPRCRECAESDGDEYLSMCEEYPPIQELFATGFRHGEEPTHEECELFYTMTQKALLLKQCMVLKQIDKNQPSVPMPRGSNFESQRELMLKKKQEEKD